MIKYTLKYIYYRSLYLRKSIRIILNFKNKTLKIKIKDIKSNIHFNY
jgi:hypothetical protein